ncbi:tRNA-modifying protein ygfZ [Erwinia amylovora NBRC 12687 = CFBP 1232]|uniref:tRNA-modifying protein ygfZ n=1 Tax=Erwinia amylovora NBRC 12687 = CFBP 1232 TaxID=1219359 RepID=A0A830ZZ90_ERWAM|nr:tRNA-modifying protein ygfZ [Erwinia amylovora NBRC 12687 = CFBP 1232]
MLNNDLAADTVLRVQGDEGGQLAIQPLPYEITAG